MMKAVDTHATRREHREGPHFAQNFKDATRASVTTRGKPREGRRSCPEFRGCFTRQRHGAPERARRSPLTSRISRTLHAPASRRTGNSEKVATCRHLRPKFRGCSMRQRHDARKTTRGSPLTPTLHAPASRRAGNSEKVATCGQNFEDAPRISTHHDET